MAVQIKLEVNSALIETVKSFDEQTLTDLCVDEMEKHIHYLESLVEGWKTYRNADNGHSRLLFLMFMSEDKRPLAEYERLVLFPKMLERQKKAAEELKNKQNTISTTAAVTTPTTVALGVQTPDSSNGEVSGFSPPLPKQEPCASSDATPSNEMASAETSPSSSKPSCAVTESLSDSSGVVQESSERERNTDRHRPQSVPGWRWVVREPNNNPDSLTGMTSNGASEFEPTGQLNNISADCETALMQKHESKLASAGLPLVRTTSITRSITRNLARDNAPECIEMQPLKNGKYVKKPEALPINNNQNDLPFEEDLTVRGVPQNPLVAGNLLVAAAAVRTLLDDKKLIGGDAGAVLQGNQSTIEGLINLESQLRNCVGMEPLPPRPVMAPVKTVDKDGAPLSRAAKKRAFKSAKKAFDIAERAWQANKKKADARQQALIAAQALATLNHSPSTPSTPAAPSSQSMFSDINLTELEMQKYIEMQESGKQDYEEGSEEHAIIMKFNQNMNAIKSGLTEKIREEQAHNSRMINEMQSFTKQIKGIADPSPFDETAEQQFLIARKFIASKIEYYKQLNTPKGLEFVEMFEYILLNCGPGVAKTIYETSRCNEISLEFDEIMLQKYKEGNIGNQPQKNCVC